MTELANATEELRQLISQLKIIQEEDTTELLNKVTKLETNEIIYEYDSEQENEENEFPVKEEGESSFQNNKRRRNDFGGYNLDEYIREQGYSKDSKREWKRFGKK